MAGPVAQPGRASNGSAADQLSSADHITEPARVNPRVDEGSGCSDSAQAAPLAASLDGVLSTCLGEFGGGQQRMLCFSGLSWASQALVMMCVVFTAQDPVGRAQWRCVDLQDRQCAAVLADTVGMRAGFCELQSQQWKWTQPRCTIAATWNLTCGQQWKVDAATAAYFIGFFFGSFLFGWISDNHGRRTCLLLSNVTTAAAAAAAALSTNFEAYALMRALAGFTSSGMPIAAMLLGTEAVGSSWRGRAGVMSQMLFNVGVWMLPLLAWALQDWRLLNLAIAACCLITALLAICLPESPRWLLVSGRADEALGVVQWLAAANGREWPQDLQIESAGIKLQAQQASDVAGINLQAQQASDAAVLHNGTSSSSSVCVRSLNITNDVQLQDTDAVTQGKQQRHQQQHVKQQEGRQGSSGCSDASEQARAWWLLISHPRMRHYIVATSLVMLIMATSYYVLSLAVNTLAGNVYVNFFIVSLAELPCQLLGLAAVDVAIIGRRGTVLYGLLGSGISCIVLGMLPAGWLQVALATLGKGACAAAWTVAYIYAQELFPVTICASAMAGTNQASRLGGVLAPIIMEFASSKAGGQGLPFVAVGIITLLAAALVGPLPETRGTQTPDTVQASDAAVKLGGGVDPDSAGAAGPDQPMSDVGAKLTHGRSGWRGCLRHLKGGRWQALPVTDVAADIECSIVHNSKHMQTSSC